MERVNLKKFGKEQYHVEISDRFAPLENLDAEVDINRTWENVAKFKYLGTTVTNQNLVHEKIKRRLNTVHNLLPSRLLSKKVKIRMHKTIVLPVEGLL
jgi:hypothetical protein